MTSHIRFTSEDPLLASAYDIISKLGKHSNPRRKWRALLDSGSVGKTSMYAFDKRGGATPAVDLEGCRVLLRALNVDLPATQMQDFELRFTSLQAEASQGPLLDLKRMIEQLMATVESLRSDIRGLQQAKREKRQGPAIPEVPKVRTTEDGQLISLFDFVAAHFDDWKRDRVRREVQESLRVLGRAVVATQSHVAFGTRDTTCASLEAANRVLEHLKHRHDKRRSVTALSSPESSDSENYRDNTSMHSISCQCLKCT